MLRENEETWTREKMWRFGKSERTSACVVFCVLCWEAGPRGLARDCSRTARACGEAGRLRCRSSIVDVHTHTVRPRSGSCTAQRRLV